MPAWLETLIGRLLAKDPSERFQSAAEVAGLLEGYLAYLRQPAVPPPELPAPSQTQRQEDKKKTGKSQLLFLGTLAALVLAGLGLLLGQQVPDPAPQAANASAQELPKEPKRFYQDFRDRPVDEDFFRYTGPLARQAIRAEAEGLRITPRFGDVKSWPTGIVFQFPVKGDCEITTSYQLLRADQPRDNSGVGVSLYIVTDTPTKEAVGFGRFHRVDGHYYNCTRITTIAGKRQWPTEAFPTEARSGRLRLVRRGATVSYLVAEEKQDEFRQLHQSELGTEDLVQVRVAADPGQNSNNPVDVRIFDFEIRALDLPADIASGPSAGPDRSRSKGAWGAFLLLALLLVFTLIPLGVWLYQRPGRAEEMVAEPGHPDESSQQQVAASPILFPCSGCGKQIKARADLAGRKTRCPQCGHPLLIPPTSSV